MTDDASYDATAHDAALDKGLMRQHELVMQMRQEQHTLKVDATHMVEVNFSRESCAAAL